MKRNILIGLLSVVCVFSAVGQKQLTNEAIWTGQSPFRMKSVESVRSMNDGEHYTALNYSKDGWIIDKYSFASYDKVGTILAMKDLSMDKVVAQNYDFNKDETKLLLETNIESIYRRSYTAKYYIHDLSNGKTSLLFDEPVMHASFSPDGKHVAYVYKNNLYVKSLDGTDAVQITSDGEYNKIINGSADWVYEEEFAISKAFQWSPGSDRIAYIKYNESEVKEFQMAMYGPLYPDQYTFKYPKAGEDNSMVSVHIFDLNKRKTKDLLIDTWEDYYVPRINWTTKNNELLVQVMNRHQNELHYDLYTIDENAAPQKHNISKKTIYKETSKTYIEIDDNLIFTADGKSFIRTSEKDGYNHIYSIGFDGSSSQITKGEWDVIEFKGLDAKKGIIYYLSAEDGAMYQNLYAINLKGKKKIKLSSKQGNNSPIFSKGMKYYINYHSSANTPYYITLHNNTGKELKVLEDNKAYNKVLEEYNVPKKEFITVDGADGKLNGWVIKPNDFDPNKKYPVYLAIYGGPGHNTVMDKFEGSTFLWQCMLAQQGYIVVSVDPRGTMYRGEKFKKSTYMQLGKLETEDMIATAKWLKKQSWVDGDRIGVQGWSYGGYMSSLCMTKGADFFKMGIAVAPVTNWRYYDSIYTERFMRTPKENADGYDDNSPINHVEKLKGPYLLVHGSADDNVHMQNTMEMINALVSANKQFDLFIYPDRNHGIYGNNARLHLFTKMHNFVKENL